MTWLSVKYQAGTQIPVEGDWLHFFPFPEEIMIFKAEKRLKLKRNTFNHWYYV